MKTRLVLFLLAWLFASVSEARYYVDIVGSRLALDYENVSIAQSTGNEITGTIELAGVGAGFTTAATSGWGYDFGLDFLGTNSEKLNPDPDWGVPWFYRFKTKSTYQFAMGLMPFIGADVLASFYQDGEAHYIGLGVLYGIGYKINERFMASINGTSSSVLFSGKSNRALRGATVELSYTF